MNPRCSALLQNQLPPKEQDPGSFILPCSIGRLDFNNALAYLGASISIMPLSMYNRLGMGKLEPINMVIEMADNTNCNPKGIAENLLVKIDKFIFQVDFVILDMVEDFRMFIFLGRPLLATAHTKAILQQKENVRQYWGSCDPYSDVCDGGGLPNNKEKRYWESVNDREREDLEWEELSLNDWMKIRDEEDDIKKNLEDPEECGEDKSNVIMGAIHDKLNYDWFNGTSEDEDDLEGILNYLEPISYDGLIDLDYEAYNKRKFLALGWHLEEIHVTWAHLEKKWTRLWTYTKSLEESCSQSVETASQA
ncbi:reverse transcriptase domain-containing protein [Tanacetum coccineum]